MTEKVYTNDLIFIVQLDLDDSLYGRKSLSKLGVFTNSYQVSSSGDQRSMGYERS